eukprot:ANDGO_01614.mRNA.1 Uncharacterized protein B0416.5
MRSAVQKWIHLLLFSLTSFANAFIWICLSVVSETSCSYFSIQSWQLNLLSIVFMVVAVPFTPVASWVLDTRSHGLRKAVYIATILQVLGAVIRYVGTLRAIVHGPSGSSTTAVGTATYYDSETSFYVVLCGQTLCAAAQAFILPSPSKLAGDWFLPSERTLATTIGALSNVLGVAFAFGITSSVVTSESDVGVFLFAQAVFCVLLGLAVAFLWRVRENEGEQGLHAASLAAIKQEFSGQVKAVLTNKPFLILLCSFGTALGVFNAVTSLLDQWVSPYGFSEDQTGILGASLIVSGIACAGAVGPLVDKYRCYATIIKTGFLTVLIAFAAFSAFLPNLGKMFTHATDGFPLLIALMVIIGAAGMCLLPVTMEASVEVVYPVGEGIPCGLLSIAGQIVGAVLLAIASVMQDQEDGSPVGSLWLMVALLVVASVLVMFFKGSYKRLAAEKLNAGSAPAVVHHPEWERLII